MTRRPSLPVGTRLGALSEVARACYISAEFEVYKLAASEAGDAQPTHLLIRKEGFEACSEADLTAWFDNQDRALLSEVQRVPNSQVPFGIAAYALTVKGTPVSGTSFVEARDGILQRLFISVVQLVQKMEKTGFMPLFNTEVSWWSASDAKMCCLIPYPTGDGADLLRYAVNGFFGIATGVSLDRGVAPPPLSQWCKFAGSRLTEIVQRCYLGNSSKHCIASLDQLLEALQNDDPRSGVESVSRAVASPTGGLSRVAGMVELKTLLERDVIKPLRDPDTYARYGLSIPNGILLFGPPGCGKTYIARQLAEELGHFFVELTPSEIASPYIHDTVLKIKDAFDRAYENAPSILFIDEFDALVPSRADLSGHQQYKSEEVNEFLAQLNGCAERRILVVAATNEPNKIDAAVKRTGRIDKVIYVGPPDLEARRDMLEYYLKGRPVVGYMDLGALAENLEGYSASDIRFLVDEAARSALATKQAISDWLIRKAMRTVPPSVSAASDAAYRSFEQRGI